MPWGTIPGRPEEPHPGWPEAPKKGLRRYRGLRWLLAERCCWMRSARLENLQHAPERGANKSGWCGLGRLLRWGCIATGKVRDQQAWLLVSCVLVLAVLSREEHCSEVQRLLHVVQGCRSCATCAATNRRPLPSHYCGGHHWRGKRTHSVDMPSEERQGRWLDGKRCNATKGRRDRARLKNGRVHKPNDAICEVTKERHEYPLAGLPIMLVLGDHSL